MSRIYSTDELARVAEIKERQQTVMRLIKDHNNAKERDTGISQAKRMVEVDVPYLIMLLENTP